MTLDLTLARISKGIGHPCSAITQTIDKFVARAGHELSCHELRLKRKSYAKWEAPKLVLTITAPDTAEYRTLDALNALSERLCKDALNDPILGRLMRGEGGQALMIELLPYEYEFDAAANA